MPANSAQPYRYGWVTTALALSGAYPDVEALGLSLGLVVAAWSLLIGLAAGFVQPWGWYVLMASYPLQLVYVPVSFLVVVSAMPRVWKLLFLAVMLIIATVSVVYFYRRRALFGATWRWRTGERWWPRLAGPDVAAAGGTQGFLGLSWRRRVGVVVVVGLLVLAKATL